MKTRYCRLYLIKVEPAPLDVGSGEYISERARHSPLVVPHNEAEVFLEPGCQLSDTPQYRGVECSGSGTA